MKKIRDIFSGNEGFTLIELLIVIVILGVLAAIAVPNLAGLTDSADEAAVKANMRTLMVELEAQKAQGYIFGEISSVSDLADTGDFSGASALISQGLFGDSYNGTETITLNSDNTLDSYTITTNESFDDITISDGSLSVSVE